MEFELGKTYFGYKFLNVAKRSKTGVEYRVQNTLAQRVELLKTLISPEQVKGVRNVDERSDLYSIGIVLYEMLCGRAPFDARSQFEVMLAHVNQVPAHVTQVNPRLPEQLDAIVLKALAKDPADRYQ